MPGRRAVCAVMLIVCALRAEAMEPLEGWFVAREACAAYHSKNKLSNPGSVSLKPQARYALRGTNAPARDWVQIVVPGAPVSTARWVPRDCGLPSPQPEQPTRSNARAETDRPTEVATDLVLALSWQPAFCETRPELPECFSLNAGSLPGSDSRFSLHGLWPQPRSAVYCGVPERLIALDQKGRWNDLPAPSLDEDTRARLDLAMPGTASHLDRHEWIKHGTCYFGGRGGDAYFDASLALLEAVNMSAVARLFAGRHDRPVRSAEVRAAFDKSFGPGAGERVEMLCLDDDGKRLVHELRIHFRGTIGVDADIGALMRAAPRRPQGCQSGIVDRAGLQ